MMPAAERRGGSMVEVLLVREKMTASTIGVVVEGKKLGRL